MKVLVTGVGGQLGFDVMNELAKRGHECIGSDILDKKKVNLTYDYIQLDITDVEAVNKSIASLQPDAVIHCAAWTAVDAAEEAINKDKVVAVNVDGTKNIAMACKKIDCKMMYLSTDYVFSGQGIEPWKADNRDYNPLNFYGKSKLEGELIVSRTINKFFIVRSSWVFGLNGNNFVKTMINLQYKFDTLKIVNDQIGSPTYTYDLSRLLVDMIESEKYGYYNATNEGNYISWYEFACEIFRLLKSEVKVIPVTTDEYGKLKTMRPCNSRLDKAKLLESGFVPLPEWKDALKRYLQELRIING